MEEEKATDTGAFASEERCCETEMASSTIQWTQETPKNLSETLIVLDPEDPLMKRFQDALKAHLTRIDNKLSDDILNLEQDVKESKKRRESKATLLYSAQDEIARQQDTVDNYEKKLIELTKYREENNIRITETKDMRNLTKKQLDIDKNMASRLANEIERLGSLNQHFLEWKREIDSHMKISRRMTEKEAFLQRDLLRQKQYEDYILSQLMEEVSRLEKEIKDCREQLEIKVREKSDAGQTITDANVDLEGLQRTQKKLFAEWNRVVTSITQRDKVNEELARERGKIRESFVTLGSQIEKLKKDTSKEMENNERLTSVQTRLEDDVRYYFGTIANEKEKIDSLEFQLIDISKLLEQTQTEFDTACWDNERCIDEDKIVDKELDKLFREKIELEDTILSKLEKKVSHDKTVKSLKKKLRETRNKMREEELAMLQTENNYGKNIFELEKLNSFITIEKYDVEDLIQINMGREKELDVMANELKKCDLVIGKKQQKIVSLNTRIEEIISSLAGGEEISPQDLRITELEKSIEETELSNRKLQEVWLRQEGYMVTLSEERASQLQEMNLLEKQITIMEQKSLKLEHEIEMRRKDNENISRTIKMLQQKLLTANARLAVQRELRDDLEDKNCITKSECIETLREDEIELLKMQNDIKQLGTDRKVVEEQLRSAQREALSWEKKVRLASETAKELKEERSAGGDVAVMKSEIHKMEIRLSHLRKAQEKMIRDMEFCVARRDVIMDGAMAREKRNPKGLHNQRIVFEKRMSDQRLKIKQMAKEIKQMENQILELERQQTSLVAQLDENQATVRAYEDNIPDIDKQINEGEIIKYHKLECLVRKQRKVRMLQDVKDGRYKMLFKSEMSLNDELHKQRSINVDLKDAMEDTRRDFPLLKESIRKIILGMEAT